MDPKLTRRRFLEATAVGLTAFVLPPARLRAAASEPVLVALYLRGGADALNLVVPAGDPFYYAHRPRIAVAAGSELPLDGLFGFHPALAPLLPLYRSGELCAVHACGSPNPTRSHFDAQDFMERAAPGNRLVLDGWLNRFLQMAGAGRPIAGVSLTVSAVGALAGAAPNVAFSGGARLTAEYQPELRAVLMERYAQLPDGALRSGALGAFEALDLVQGVSGDTSAAYPATPLGAALRDAAALVKSEVGVRVIAVDAGGWDHHSSENTRLPGLAKGLADSLAAFREDLGSHAARTLTLCMSEFGRRVRENGSAGCEHGRAGVMLALGGGVAGGRVRLRGDRWPGLAPEQLDGGHDLAVTTDFRDVFAEALHRHMGVSLASLAPVFPSFALDAARLPGLYA